MKHHFTMTLLLSLTLFPNLTKASDCKRDLSKLQKDEEKFLNLADKASGTHQISGVNCQNLEIKVEDKCDEMGEYSYTTVNINLKLEDSDETVGPLFTIPTSHSMPGVRNPNFSSSKKKMKMIQAYSSQGGIGNGSDSTKLSFTREGKLKSVNVVERYGIIFQWTYLDATCNVAY
ncbi:MAG: hypothetical protein ACOYL6_09130 [Bacteriovoracaceae bacterium]